MTVFAYVKVHLSFEGTHYAGWQRQPNALTVQEVVEDVLQTIYRQKISVKACGRTDAGVHAHNFVIAFPIPHERIPISKLPHALNAYFPEDIRAHAAKTVPKTFHATADVVKKTYRYTICNRSFPAVFGRQYCLYIPKSLDVAVMHTAASFFVGKHDFTSFCAESERYGSCERHIMACDVYEQEQWITISVTANGFLYNMVRIIVGTLIAVGQRKYVPTDIKDMLRARNRKQAGPTAPAKGLALYEVEYK